MILFINLEEKSVFFIARYLSTIFQFQEIPTFRGVANAAPWSRILDHED